ncbi:MAG: SpoIID/LytB domain-containing protein [Oscillospiraceae bacterium]|nr:SpoIID/LytB domain-containing protein [Oscillospiraceae bacterium]
MRKSVIAWAAAFALLLLCVPVGAAGSAYIYINSSSGAVSGGVSSLYAVGSEGVSRLGSDTVWALTASGLEQLSAEQEEPTSVTGGGGGLISINGKIGIASRTVKVGLAYYYNAYRDSSLSAARLENSVGSGYEFGYFDSDRDFVALDGTDETRLTMRVTSGTGIGVYSTDTGQLLYSVSSTGSGSKLAIMPVSDDDDAETWFAGYKYRGGFEYAVLGGGTISVINVVDIEDYVMGVCAGEMSGSWPLEALKAQAVCARSYAAKYMMSSAYYYSCGFDVTNDTYCQSYTGCTYVNSRITEAVNATENEYLTYDGEMTEALYFSSDGGATEDNYNVNGNNDHPYLKGVYDPYESKTDSLNHYSSWTVTYTADEIASLTGLADVEDVDTVLSETGNVIQITFTSSGGLTRTYARSACRTSLGLYSIRYDVTVGSDGSVEFTGSGWGHNLGMSQYGAYAMAAYYDADYEDILGYYFTDVSISMGYLK